MMQIRETFLIFYNYNKFLRLGFDDRSKLCNTSFITFSQNSELKFGVSTRNIRFTLCVLLISNFGHLKVIFTPPPYLHFNFWKIILIFFRDRSQMTSAKIWNMAKKWPPHTSISTPLPPRQVDVNQNAHLDRTHTGCIIIDRYNCDFDLNFK